MNGSFRGRVTLCKECPHLAAATDSEISKEEIEDVQGSRRGTFLSILSWTLRHVSQRARRQQSSAAEQSSSMRTQ